MVPGGIVRVPCVLFVHQATSTPSESAIAVSGVGGAKKQKSETEPQSYLKGGFRRESTRSVIDEQRLAH